MTDTGRPLSPHLQIYRPQLTSVLSIAHRASGVALGAGLPVLVWWLIAGASGPGAYGAFQDFSGSAVGRLLLAGWSFALFYHLCNGIRHLFWDAGRGFELRAVHASGRLVVLAAVALTIVAWIWGYASLGAFE